MPGDAVDPAVHPPTTFRQSWLWWTLPTLCVLVLGSVFLPAPFTGDQALYSLGGRAILDGQLMYTDFWDIKHPGVHFFYATAHALFGQTGLAAETQVHLLEFLLWITCGVLLQRVLRNRLENPLVAAAGPLATGAAYFATASHRGLTQIEALPGLFLAAAWCLSLPSQSAEKSKEAKPWPLPIGPLTIGALATGALAATAVVFHGHMLPVPVALLGTAYIGRTHGLRQLAWSLAALVLSLILFASFFAVQRGFDGLWEVFVSYPLEAANQVPAERQGLDRIRWPLSEFLKTYLPWLILAGLAFAPLPSRSKGQIRLKLPKLRRAPVQAATWGATALVVMLLETRTSWPFHYLYFVMPVGLVAIFGLDRLATWVGSLGPGARTLGGPLALAVALVALAPSLAGSWQREALALAGHVRTSGIASFDKYRDTYSDKYADIRNAVSFLHQDTALPGPIYVFGDPLHHTLGERGQALKRSGWGWEVYLSEHWKTLAAEIEDARPAYILVEPAYVPLIQEHAPRAWDVLESQYEQLRPGEGPGQWYRTRQVSRVD